MSSPAIPSPPSDASASVRGLVNTGSQTFEGAKTFNQSIVFAAGKGITGASGASLLENGTGWITPANTRLDSAGYYLCSGGVLGGLNAAGLNATAGSYGADVYQAQSSYEVSVYSEKGASAGVVAKIGSGAGSPHADAELLRVAYGVGSYLASDGTPVLKVMGDNRCIFGAKNTAPNDANLMAGSISFYLDEAGNNLKVRVKYANGSTLKTGTLAIV